MGDRPLVQLLCFFALSAAQVVSWAGETSYSPYVQRDYPTSVYWGDTHLHTSYSVDAYFLGNRLDHSTAYQLARGERVTASNGMEVRLGRPLDFLVIADHAESLGLLTALETRNRSLLATDAGRRLLRQYGKSAGSPTSPEVLAKLFPILEEAAPWSRTQPDTGTGFQDSIWKAVTAAADRYNQPGRFTAFIGYEWTAWGGGTGDNLHRVVIFKDGAEKANRVLPFSAAQSSDPEDLWTYMSDYEARTGGQMLAIPHNGNLSGGAMFSLTDFKGNALTSSYAQRRARWEPLYEVTQIKGTSEVHPFLSPSDEYANYEIWNSWQGKTLPTGRNWDPTEAQRKEGEYARPALKRGLLMEERLGANPFKFGFVGGTDAHTSLPAIEENNFWGKAPITNPNDQRATADKLTIDNSIDTLRKLFGEDKIHVDALNRSWQMSASGYAAVWATENTRDAIFTAMKRRETYATTGPRITVRFFGGWDFHSSDALAPDLADVGYRKGVPMGSDITNPPMGRSPSFLIHAVKDPEGANLDRVQIIKGWLDANGETQEIIYDVVRSAAPFTHSSGNSSLQHASINVRNASYTNSIGSPELSVVWVDPTFKDSQRAFYYLRVIEIPTPRWTAYDAKFFNQSIASKDIPTTVQERAFTSPIWYRP